jgi:archaemetzincin
MEVFSSRSVFDLIREALAREFHLESEWKGTLILPSTAFASSRGQYNASVLLAHLFKNTKKIALWVVDSDLYVEGMNFVFGIASRKGAVLSTARLFSPELIKKEVLHEVGHVLGLEHCLNDCVMQFSNSLLEAERKPGFLCEKCRELLKVK